MRRSDIARYGAFCGIDVGKSSNCAVVLDRSCDEPLIRREVAQDEGEIRALILEAAAIGEVLVTVDQYGAFGRLAVAVARDVGVDVATIAAEIADVSRFGDAAHLASYAGVAPVRETSGSSVDKKKKRKGGNRRLKNAVIRSAHCAAQVDDRAAAYYKRKRAEGKGHKQALRALARRRIDVIYALLSNGTFYEAQHTAS